MVAFLYGQTEYNMLNSSLKLEDYVKKASSYGYTSLSITDPNLHGHYKFYKLCKEHNIKPIIGLELKIYSLTNDINNILAYALNNEGYKELLKLSSKDKINQYIFKLDELYEYKNLLFVSTMNSDTYLHYRQIDNFITKYLKLNNFAIGLSYACNSFFESSNYLYEYAKTNNINILPISQTLYDTEQDYDAYEALCLINNKTPITNVKLYYKDAKELEEEFFMHEDVFDNLDKIIAKVDISINKVSKSLPSYEMSSNNSSDVYLKSLCYKGLLKRLENNNKNYNKYKQRLDYELTVIHSMGYDDYFLIVWDYVKYAKKEGIMVGPGRGSAAGSLVSYCLGITNVDPLKYDLLFERFLNHQRVSMPDIDMDFPDDKREEVINYVKDKYGKNRVCSISAFGTFQVKSSIRDIGKAYKIKSQDLDIISKLASNTKDYESLKNEYKHNEEIYKLLTVAKKIEGLPRHITTHAAGVIISSDELINNIPLTVGSTSLYQSQLDSSDLADLGLLKMDFLGIRNLTILNNIALCIPNMNNITINNIPLNDSNTYRLLQNGDTDGIFQLESEGIKKVLNKLKPTCFNDIVAVLALYRPGPMDNIDEYIKRKFGKKFTYLHNDLEPILKETYGIIVYQEQIMQIAYKFAKMSLAEADILRRAVSKKDKKLLDENRLLFVSKCISNNYNNDIANQIYDYIVKFANYGFNKSHSVAYSMISYQMAYFKANYFSLFMSKYLNNLIGNTSSIETNLKYIKRKKIEVLSPDINLSTLEFECDEKSVRYPLTGIYQIGNNIATKIIEERKNGPYLSFDDFKKRLPFVGKNVLEALIYSGAFDSFGKTKKSLLQNSDPLEAIFNKQLKDVKIDDSEFSLEHLRLQESKYIGFNILYDPFKDIDKLQIKHNSVFFSKKMLLESSLVIVEFSDIKEIKTKKGDLMLLGNVSDGKRTIKLVIFPYTYSNIKNKVSLDGLYLTKGKLSYNSNYNNYEYQLEDIYERIR